MNPQKFSPDSISAFSEHDALVVVDMQNDFLPGGALAVPRGDEVVPILNDYIAEFAEKRLPIFATRDWHPENHCSFKGRGGSWPRHCVRGTLGAEFSSDLHLLDSTIVISKATAPQQEAYSGFEGTELGEKLRDRNVQRLFVGGLATDYCVLNTVKDALRRRFQVVLLQDAIRAVNIQPDDGANAEREMLQLGAIPLRRAEVIV
jgi:nicotinamidase/pyrazinamidase